MNDASQRNPTDGMPIGMALPANGQTRTVMARLGFGMRAIHQGPHPDYSRQVQEAVAELEKELNRLRDATGVSRADYDRQAREMLESLQDQRFDDLSTRPPRERLASDDDDESSSLA